MFLRIFALMPCRHSRSATRQERTLYQVQGLPNAQDSYKAPKQQCFRSVGFTQVEYRLMATGSRDFFRFDREVRISYDCQT